MISIGNVAVGGRAKTPLAALLASRLRDMGERPAILSRGYARRLAPDGVVVVRDPDGIRADLNRAGDEPLMLARQLAGVAVLTGASRYLAGHLAERHFGCTVHILDDGFQHFELRRDADIVVIAAGDIEGARTLPSGRLREPLDAMAAADAVIALGDDVPLAPLRLDGRPAWRARRRLESVRTPGGGEDEPHPGDPVLAMAGIAEPSAFFHGVRAAGWRVVREMAFRDHHPYSRADVAAVMQAAKAAGAAAVLTTEKDWVRLLPYRPFSLPVAYAPLAVDIDGIETLDVWLRGRLDAARAGECQEYGAR